MYLADCHTHTSLSPDGFSPLEDMARAARGAGLQELCATDHWDLLDGDGKRTLDHPWAPHLEQYDRAAPAFPEGLRVKLGMELGSPQIAPETAAALLDQPRLDFVIGSVHNWSEGRGGRDFYYTAFHSPDHCLEAMEDYFDSLEAMAGLPGCFDVVGHLNYPLRYMARDGYPMALSQWEGRLRSLLRRVAEGGRGIEVNTNRGAGLAGWEHTLALYRSCGGEIVTLGSDAHRPDDVGRGIREGCALLRSAGFRYVTTFSRRQPEFHKL